MNTPTEIIGIDPGYGNPGAAALDLSGKLLRVATFSGEEGASTLDMSVRAYATAASIIRWITFVKGPKVIGIEGPALHEKRFKSVEMLARCRQAVFDACMVYLPDMVYFEIPPATAKMAATGSGNADKETVARCVSKIFSINLPSSAGTRYASSDAIAIAMATQSKWIISKKMKESQS